jgi:hypothetical protein|tara:strand:+ start:71 stop:319 length:249 start_codon:yes stop_codon:yes gene_type:complete
MGEETYYVAKLVVNEEFRSSEIFESLEEARLWGMREAKLEVSDSALRRMDVTSGDVRVEIDEHFFGYECSMSELLSHSERVS